MRRRTNLRFGCNVKLLEPYRPAEFRNSSAGARRENRLRIRMFRPPKIGGRAPRTDTPTIPACRHARADVTFRVSGGSRVPPIFAEFFRFSIPIPAGFGVGFNSSEVGADGTSFTLGV